MKRLTYLAVGTVTAALLMSSPASRAQTSTDVATQELELKKKELDLEKAKIEQQKVAELSVQKAQVDLEAQKLALEKAKQDLAVKETAERLDMQLKGDVLFDTNEAVLKPGARETLDKVATVLAAFPTGKITVTGHADARGSDAINMKLSRDRAEAVKTWLLARSGASSERVIAVGVGEEEPVASNATSDGRQLNRRVDISVAKL